MKKYVPIVAMKIPFDKSANVVTSAGSNCWEIVTNRLGGGVCTTEEPGHVNEWVNDNTSAYQYCD